MLFFGVFWSNLPIATAQQCYSSFIQTEPQTSGKLPAGSIISWKSFLTEFTPKQSTTGTVWRLPCLLTSCHCLLRATTIRMDHLGGSGCGSHRAGPVTWWSDFLLPGFLGLCSCPANGCPDSLRQWTINCQCIMVESLVSKLVFDLGCLQANRLRRIFRVVPQSGGAVPTQNESANSLPQKTGFHVYKN